MAHRGVHKLDRSEEHSSQVLLVKIKNSAVTKIILVTMVAALGYVAGINHYRIEGALAPMFGLKSNSGYIDLSSVEATYSALASHYDGTLNTQKLIDGANKGLVEAAGDDYTVYMDTEEAQDYNDSLSGDIGGGIGVEISTRNDQITIIGVLEDNPAKKAGLQSGDVILAVNGDSTNNWSVDKTATKIRGEVGTTVKLTILRDDEVKSFSITRAEVNNPSVTSSTSGTIGIITISRFDEETGDLARSAAQKLLDKGAKSIILDLRGNGGGYVTAAQDVAGLWLNDKKVVTEKTGSTVKSTLTTGDDAILSGVPTVVLVDGATASASEIVSGALKDYGVATLVGTKTFGKGSVQQLIDLNDGALLKVTVAKWYTPNGKNINESGITPDKVVNLTQANLNNNQDPQMDEAKSILSK